MCIFSPPRIALRFECKPWTLFQRSSARWRRYDDGVTLGLNPIDGDDNALRSLPVQANECFSGSEHENE